MPAIFEIRDESDKDRLVGNLFYYRRRKRFYIELPKDIDEWSAPFLFSHFVKRGYYSIDSEWSYKWVQQRIVPPDRQNLGMILKDAGMKEYDAYGLLVRSQGRCAQDELYIKSIDKTLLLPEISDRINTNIKDVLVLKGRGLYVFFKDKRTRFINKEELAALNDSIANYIRDDDRFYNITVGSGGHSLMWNEDREVTAEVLKGIGKPDQLGFEDIERFIIQRTLNTADICDSLHCSRQYVTQLVNKGTLDPVKQWGSMRLFLKGDMEQA